MPQKGPKNQREFALLRAPIGRAGILSNLGTEYSGRHQRKLAPISVPQLASPLLTLPDPLLDPPRLDLGRVQAAVRGIDRDAVRVVELALGLAVGAQRAEHLTGQAELDDAVVFAVAHVDRI